MSSLQDLDAKLKKARKKYPEVKRRAYACSLAGLLSLSFATGMYLKKSPYFRFDDSGLGLGWIACLIPACYAPFEHKNKRRWEREQRELPRSISDRAEYLLKETREGHRSLTRRNEITYGILNRHIDQEDYHLALLYSTLQREQDETNKLLPPKEENLNDQDFKDWFEDDSGY